RPSPSCAHDDDRLRLPPASPSRSNSAEKKESTDPRLSQLCPPYVTPSSSSSLEHHRSDARIVENGSAAASGMSNSAKVGLARPQYSSITGPCGRASLRLLAPRRWWRRLMKAPTNKSLALMSKTPRNRRRYSERFRPKHLI